MSSAFYASLAWKSGLTWKAACLSNVIIRFSMFYPMQGKGTRGADRLVNWSGKSLKLMAAHGCPASCGKGCPPPPESQTGKDSFQDCCALKPFTPFPSKPGWASREASRMVWASVEDVHRHKSEAERMWTITPLSSALIRQEEMGHASCMAAKQKGVH